MPNERADLRDILADGLADIRERTHPIQEICDRMKRLESKVSSFLVANGHPMHTTKPAWEAGTDLARGVVRISSMNSSIADVLAAIPEGSGAVQVMHKDKHLGLFTPAD